MKRAIAIASALVALAASCSSPDPLPVPFDGGATTCNGVTCPSGTACLFAPAPGCAAIPSCLAPPLGGSCKAVPACSCNGTDTSVCGNTTQPFAHFGACSDAQAQCAVACEDCVDLFTSSTMSTPAKDIGACTPSEISAVVAACLSASATSTTCEAWQGNTFEAGSCEACVFSDQNGPVWGPVVCNGSSCKLDVGGCTDLVLGETSLEQASNGPGSCGDLIDASDDCIATACATCGKTGDTDACKADVPKNVCKSYVDAVASSPLCQSDAGALASCSPTTDAQYTRFVNIFCGTGP